MSALLSSKQAAAHLGVSDDFIRTRVKAGELASYRFGRVLRFSTADLDEFAERQRVPAAVAPIPVPRRRAGGLSYEASVAALRARDIDALRAATRPPTFEERVRITRSHRDDEGLSAGRR